jgi:hypothetical protein
LIARDLILLSGVKRQYLALEACHEYPDNQPRAQHIGLFPRLVEVLKDQQDNDDRAENDHPIGNLNTRYRCFLLEPFHCLPPRPALWDNSKSGQDRPIGSAAKLFSNDEARRQFRQAAGVASEKCQRRPIMERRQ